MESATTTRFFKFVQRQRVQKRLDRIIVNEYHVILASTPDFRPKIRKLNQLGLLETQLVYLTTTLPPKIEPRWLYLIGISSNRLKVFREATSRSNIRYQILDILN